jgi:hypothetical protein
MAASAEAKGGLMKLGRIVVAALFTIFSQAASASETITYTYDALGRVVKVARTGTVNNGVTANYSYDKADNRTNVTVTGAPAGTGAGDGAAVPSSLYIVVPLNGYTLIKIQ